MGLICTIVYVCDPGQMIDPTGILIGPDALNSVYKLDFVDISPVIEQVTA